ncbi:MAG: type III pantothenate kinase, partial [Cyanobacteria bacterium J06627_28]
MDTPSKLSKQSEHWLALIIGNTRLHWGYFYQESLVGAWHTPHLTEAIAAHLNQSQFQATAWTAKSPHATPQIHTPQIYEWTNQITCSKIATFPESPVLLRDLWIASAVPAQAQLWKEQANVVVRSHIPITDLYSTLGIDRAVTLLGAGATTGWPCLVIDGGTALTFTAAKANDLGQGKF